MLGSLEGILTNKRHRPPGKTFPRFNATFLPVVRLTYVMKKKKTTPAPNVVKPSARRPRLLLDAPAASPKAKPATIRHNKTVSAFAWIQDEFGRVLLVKKTKSQGAWGFPGGKVDPGESLAEGLNREILEELNLKVGAAEPIAVFERPQRSAVAVLYRALLLPGNIELPQGELEAWDYRKALPGKATASTRYFWNVMQRKSNTTILYVDGVAEKN